MAHTVRKPPRAGKPGVKYGDLKIVDPEIEPPPYPQLYPAQRAFVEDPARYTVCEAGTKSGKTLGCAAWLVRNAWEQDDTIWWWVAPTHAQAMIAFEIIVHGDRMTVEVDERRGGRVQALLQPPRQCKVRRSGACPEILLFNGSLIQFRTANDPNRLYGAGIAGAVLDEASRMGERAFVAVRSTLTMTRGPLKIIGNPCGTRNWFFRLCQRARSDGGEYSYHHLCSADNPFIPPEEIEDARLLLPEREFKELYLGEAQPGEGQVFNKIDAACVLEETEAFIPGHRYVLGWDPARKVDYSVVSVLDYTEQPFREVGIERLSSLEFELQLDRIKALSQEYGNAPVVFDATAMGGDLLAEWIRKRGIPSLPFSFTAISKAEIVNRMISHLESGWIRLQGKSSLARIARDELCSFEGKHSRNGLTIRFSAPEGVHDDTVMARCLALHGAEKRIMPAQIGAFEYVVGKKLLASARFELTVIR